MQISCVFFFFVCVLLFLCKHEWQPKVQQRQNLGSLLQHNKEKGGVKCEAAATLVRLLHLSRATTSAALLSTVK